MTNTKKISTYFIAVIAIVIIGIVISIHKKTISTSKDQQQVPVTEKSNQTSTTLPGLQTGSVPWNMSVDHLKDRLTAIGLPALTAEGTALHIHQHLDMNINGETITIPPHIGINETAGFISTIHVHDTTGIIHVESPTIANFTLGQFFDIWGVRFTSTCIGGYCTNADDTLRIYINGKLYEGNPRDIVLTGHQELFIFYGTIQQLPKTIPATYTFPTGY